MRLQRSLLVIGLAAPALVVAIALGPVILGILCAVGFGLLVMALVDIVIGLGLAARSAARGGARFVHGHS